MIFYLKEKLGPKKDYFLMGRPLAKGKEIVLRERMRLNDEEEIIEPGHHR